MVELMVFINEYEHADYESPMFISFRGDIASKAGVCNFQLTWVPALNKIHFNTTNDVIGSQMLNLIKESNLSKVKFIIPGNLDREALNKDIDLAFEELKILI